MIQDNINTYKIMKNNRPELAAYSGMFCIKEKQ